MTHPLTDKICYEMALKSKAWNLGFSNDDMRVAADWQLEQVIKWLEETECNRYNNVKIIHANDLRAAMRPQQQENN